MVVLAWDAVLRGAADVRDGHNVVLHEFAHQLDTEDGAADGAPVLPRRAAYGPWARVLGAAYDGLLRDAASGDRTVIDTYGAKNPAEFFAVVTEAFFERPRALRARHPALYEQMRAFYRQRSASSAGPRVDTSPAKSFHAWGFGSPSAPCAPKSFHAWGFGSPSAPCARTHARSLAPC